MSLAAYEAEINAAKEHKAESLVSPDGVKYMDQLWEIIENEVGLSVVLRTDEETFTDVPVPVRWTHGHYHWQSETDREKSELVFLVPDEVTRRIQSAHAGKVFQRFFGKEQEAQLDEPFTSPEMIVRETSFGEDDVSDVITADWEKLKEAIHATTEDPSGHLGGQMIEADGAFGRGVAQARVNGDDLEIYLGQNITDRINSLWAEAFRHEVMLDQKSVW
jgi:hypothetical protein